MRTCGGGLAGGRQRQQVASALVSGPSLPALARCRLPGAQPREGRSGGRDQEAAAAAVGGWGVGQLQLGRENCVSVGEPRASRSGRRDVLCLGIQVGWARDRKTKKNLGRTPGHGPGGPGCASAPDWPQPGLGTTGAGSSAAVPSATARPECHAAFRPLRPWNDAANRLYPSCAPPRIS